MELELHNGKTIETAKVGDTGTLVRYMPERTYREEVTVTQAYSELVAAYYGYVTLTNHAAHSLKIKRDIENVNGWMNNDYNGTVDTSIAWITKVICKPNKSDGSIYSSSSFIAARQKETDGMPPYNQPKGSYHRITQIHKNPERTVTCQNCMTKMNS
jgi:hypothetical protein